MFHDESWKTILLGDQKVKGQGHESQKSAGVGLCTLVSAGFFQFAVLLVWDACAFLVYLFV